MLKNTDPPRTWISHVAVLFLVLWSVATDAKAFQFEKIADTSNSIPGGVGNFTSFHSVITDGADVWFIGSGNDVPQPQPSAGLRQSGIYRARHNSPLDTIFDKMSDPRFSRSVIGNFVGLSVDQGDMSFGFSSSSPSHLRYVINGVFGEVSGVDVYQTVIDQEVVVLKNPGIGASIFKSVQGTLSTLVDGTNTPIPDGAGTFTRFYSIAVDGNDLSFFGNDMRFLPDDGIFIETQRGIYKQINGTLETVADLNTPIPNGIGFFTDFGGVSDSGGISIDNQQVLFVGKGSSDQIGIFLQQQDGSLEAIITQQTAIPEATGTFTNFSEFTTLSSSIVLDGDMILFYGKGTDVEGIYSLSLRDNALSKIIDTNDILDGKSILGLGFFDEGLDNLSLAFTASFTNGSRGVFLTTIPEPATLSFLALGFLLTLRRRHDTRNIITL